MPNGHPYKASEFLFITSSNVTAKNDQKKVRLPKNARGGGRGIRTPGGLAPTTVFKTAALNHSAIPPRLEKYTRP